MASDEPIAQPTESSTHQSETKPNRLTMEEFEALLASETPEKPLTFVLKYRDQVIGSSAEGPVSEAELQRRLSEAVKK